MEKLVLCQVTLKLTLTSPRKTYSKKRQIDFFQSEDRHWTLSVLTLLQWSKHRHWTLSVLTLLQWSKHRHWTLSVLTLLQWSEHRHWTLSVLTLLQWSKHRHWTLSVLTLLQWSEHRPQQLRILWNKKPYKHLFQNRPYQGSSARARRRSIRSFPWDSPNRARKGQHSWWRSFRLWRS